MQVAAVRDPNCKAPEAEVPVEDVSVQRRQGRVETELVTGHSR